MPRLSAVRATAPDLVATATLSIETNGEGFIEIVSLHVPIVDGELVLGTWQGLYLIEHRARPHRREVVLQFVGSRKAPGA